MQGWKEQMYRSYNPHFVLNRRLHYYAVVDEPVTFGRPVEAYVTEYALASISFTKSA